MGLYGTIWDSMGLYGTIWDPMGLYGTIWDPMGLYGIFVGFRRLCAQEWPSYAPGWPSYAPQWGLRADLFEKRPKSLKNASFLRFFHQGVQIGCKSRKTGFYVFCVFTPLYRRFSISHALQTMDLEGIYRFASNIFHFMPCGSAFETLWKFYRNSKEILLKFN